MLVVEDMSAGYGSSLVIEKVSLAVKEASIVALIGPNGAGKTTCLRAISGLIPAKAGRISFRGKSIGGLPGHRIVRMGLALVPEGRLVFERLTVRENLLLGAYPVGAARRNELLESAFSLFPVLKERQAQQAGTLSGGEQQMLAIARGLMSDPKMLILDEPSMGLAPKLVMEVFDFVRRLNQELGLTVLISEQNAYQALAISDWAYVLESGAIVMSGDAAELAQQDEVQRRYLGKVG